MLFLKLKHVTIGIAETREGAPRTLFETFSGTLPRLLLFVLLLVYSLYFVGQFERMQNLKPRNACAVGIFLLSGARAVMLQRFGLDRSLASPDLVSFSQSQYMTLDAVTLRDLEVSLCTVPGWSRHASVERQSKWVIL